MNVYGGLSECCTVLWGLSVEWHSYRLAEIPNKYRNSLSVLQAQTAQIAQINMHILYQLYKYKSIGGSYLEISTGSDSV